MAVKNTKKNLEKDLTYSRKMPESLKGSIRKDDGDFNQAVKAHHVKEMLKAKSPHTEVVAFSNTRGKVMEEEHQWAELVHRQDLFNRLIELISRYLSQNLCEMLYENKLMFRNVFCNKVNKTTLEVSLCFNKKDLLDCDPSIDEHRSNFLQLFEDAEDSIFKNQFLSFYMQDLTEFFFEHPEIAVE